MATAGSSVEVEAGSSGEEQGIEYELTDFMALSDLDGSESWSRLWTKAGDDDLADDGGAPPDFLLDVLASDEGDHAEALHLLAFVDSDIGDMPSVSVAGHHSVFENFDELFAIGANEQSDDECEDMVIRDSWTVADARQDDDNGDGDNSVGYVIDDNDDVNNLTCEHSREQEDELILTQGSNISTGGVTATPGESIDMGGTEDAIELSLLGEINDATAGVEEEGACNQSAVLAVPKDSEISSRIMKKLVIQCLVSNKHGKEGRKLRGMTREGGDKVDKTNGIAHDGSSNDVDERRDQQESTTVASPRSVKDPSVLSAGERDPTKESAESNKIPGVVGPADDAMARDSSDKVNGTSDEQESGRFVMLRLLRDPSVTSVNETHDKQESGSIVSLRLLRDPSITLRDPSITSVNQMHDKEESGSIVSLRLLRNPSVTKVNETRDKQESGNIVSLRLLRDPSITSVNQMQDKQESGSIVSLRLLRDPSITLRDPSVASVNQRDEREESPSVDSVGETDVSKGDDGSIASARLMRDPSAGSIDANTSNWQTVRAPAVQSRPVSLGLPRDPSAESSDMRDQLEKRAFFLSQRPSGLSGADHVPRDPSVESGIEKESLKEGNTHRSTASSPLEGSSIVFLGKLSNPSVKNLTDRETLAKESAVHNTAEHAGSDAPLLLRLPRDPSIEDVKENDTLTALTDFSVSLRSRREPSIASIINARLPSIVNSAREPSTASDLIEPFIAIRKNETREDGSARDRSGGMIPRDPLMPSIDEGKNREDGSVKRQPSINILAENPSIPSADVEHFPVRRAPPRDLSTQGDNEMRVKDVNEKATLSKKANKPEEMGGGAPSLRLPRDPPVKNADEDDTLIALTDCGLSLKLQKGRSIASVHNPREPSVAIFSDRESREGGSAKHRSGSGMTPRYLSIPSINEGNARKGCRIGRDPSPTDPSLLKGSRNDEEGGRERVAHPREPPQFEDPSVLTDATAKRAPLATFPRRDGRTYYSKATAKQPPRPDIVQYGVIPFSSSSKANTKQPPRPDIVQYGVIPFSSSVEDRQLVHLRQHLKQQERQEQEQTKRKGEQLPCPDSLRYSHGGGISSTYRDAFSPSQPKHPQDLRGSNIGSIVPPIQVHSIAASFSGDEGSPSQSKHIGGGYYHLQDRIRQQRQHYLQHEQHQDSTSLGLSAQAMLRRKRYKEILLKRKDLAQMTTGVPGLVATAMATAR